MADRPTGMAAGIMPEPVPPPTMPVERAVLQAVGKRPGFEAAGLRAHAAMLRPGTQLDDVKAALRLLVREGKVKQRKGEGGHERYWLPDRPEVERVFKLSTPPPKARRRKPKRKARAKPARSPAKPKPSPAPKRPKATSKPKPSTAPEPEPTLRALAAKVAQRKAAPAAAPVDTESPAALLAMVNERLADIDEAVQRLSTLYVFHCDANLTAVVLTLENLAERLADEGRPLAVSHLRTAAAILKQRRTTT